MQDQLAGKLDQDALLGIAEAIIRSHPRLFADNGLPNNGEQAAAIVAKRAAQFVRTLAQELSQVLAEEQVPSRRERPVETPAAPQRHVGPDDQ